MSDTARVIRCLGTAAADAEASYASCQATGAKLRSRKALRLVLRDDGQRLLDRLKRLSVHLVRKLANRPVDAGGKAAVREVSSSGTGPGAGPPRLSRPSTRISSTAVASLESVISVARSARRGGEAIGAGSSRRST